MHNTNTALAIDSRNRFLEIALPRDLNDNRLTRHAGLDPASSETISENYGYPPATNRLNVREAIKTGTEPFTDLPPTRDLVYNDAGRLKELHENGELKAGYRYNADGQRTRKVIHHGDGSEEIILYHYDLMGYLISETDEAGNLIRDYLWSEPMTPVAQIDSDGFTETLTYLHTDHLMTNRLATDEFQAIVWRWEGEAFGSTLPEELAGFSINLRFPGQYYDEETNLYYNWHRYYDPQLGRYITSDPIGLMGGLGTYLYALGNPLGALDPFGLMGESAVYRHGHGQYSDRRNPGGSGACMRPIWAGGFIIDWVPCDARDECPPEGDGDRRRPDGPGSGSEPHPWPGFPGHPGFPAGGDPGFDREQWRKDNQEWKDKINEERANRRQDCNYQMAIGIARDKAIELGARGLAKAAGKKTIEKLIPYVGGAKTAYDAVGYLDCLATTVPIQ